MWSALKWKNNLLLENPLLKILLLEDERSDWVNPIFDERGKVWRVSNFVPNAAAASTKIFSVWGQTHSGTSYIILIS